MEVSAMQQIVIVEDNEHIRESFQRFLTKQGFDVVVYTSAQAAIDDILHVMAADLVISDIETGSGSDGLELLENIRDIDPLDIAVIIISGNLSLYQDNPLLALADRTFQKPIQLHDLLAAIESLVG